MSNAGESKSQSPSRANFGVAFSVFVSLLPSDVTMRGNRMRCRAIVTSAGVWKAAELFVLTLIFAGIMPIIHVATLEVRAQIPGPELFAKEPGPRSSSGMRSIIWSAPVRPRKPCRISTSS